MLAEHLPKRLAQMLGDDIDLPGMIGDFSDKKIAPWSTPSSKPGHSSPSAPKATAPPKSPWAASTPRDLDSTTMEARSVPGLYFIGEVVDVTGWLGGYNFQWAWASGWAAGQVA